jgi:hypothetical protein
MGKVSAFTGLGENNDFTAALSCCSMTEMKSQPTSELIPYSGRQLK